MLRGHVAPNFQTSLEIGGTGTSLLSSNWWGRKADMRAEEREVNDHLFRANYVVWAGP